MADLSELSDLPVGCVILDCKPKCMNGEPAVWFGTNEMGNIVNETMENGTMTTELIQETTVLPTVCVNATEMVNATDDTGGFNVTMTSCTELHGHVEQGYWECQCPSFDTTGESIISIRC